MNVSKKITIDLNNPRKNVVHLGQGDNQHQIVLTLLKDGMPFDVSEGIGTATLVAGVHYIKANGIGGYYDWTSTDMAAVALATGTTNVWNVLIDEHATDVPGFAQIFVKFSLASGETLYSFPITLDVIRTSGGTTDPDKPYYHSTSFLLAGAQAAKTPAMIFPVGVDGDGKLWAEGGWSDEAKEALIACFEQVAWKTPYGQTYLSALETALYPDVHLVSITAAYDQDRPIYDSDSAADNYAKVKLDLIVTALYSDGTSEAVTNYTLSGTFTAGTSTITVSYGGKTANISVSVLQNLDSIAYGELTYRDIFETNNFCNKIGDFETAFTISTTEQDLGDGWSVKSNAGSPALSTEAADTPTHSLKCFGTGSTQIYYKNTTQVFPVGSYLVCVSAKVSRYSSGYCGIQANWPGTTPTQALTNLGVQATTSGFTHLADIVALDSAQTGFRAYIGTFLSANLDGYVDDIVASPVPSTMTATQGLELYEKYLQLKGVS